MGLTNIRIIGMVLVQGFFVGTDRLRDRAGHDLPDGRNPRGMKLTTIPAANDMVWQIPAGTAIAMALIVLVTSVLQPPPRINFGASRAHSANGGGLRVYRKTIRAVVHVATFCVHNVMPFTAATVFDRHSTGCRAPLLIAPCGWRTLASCSRRAKLIRGGKPAACRTEPTADRSHLIPNGNSRPLKFRLPNQIIGVCL